MSDRETEWAEAMRSALAGDAHAYTRLLSDVADAVRGLIRRRVARFGLAGDETEDIVQEVLISLHQKRGSWDGSRPFLPWLHAIVRYKISDAGRRAARHRRLYANIQVADWAEHVANPAEDAAAAPAFDLPANLRFLTARQRSVVEGLTTEGLTVRALSRRLTMSENAIHVTWHLALARLAGRLGVASPSERGGLMS